MIQEMESVMRLLRAARTAETQALGTNEADTNREYYFIAASSVMREAAQRLEELARQAHAAETEHYNHSLDARSRRQQLKKQ